jgi:hypothetical protein
MPQRLDDQDLMKISHLLVLEADSYLQEVIIPQRAKALRYYMGENPDNVALVDGRSKMVDTQLRDTIEWIMPDLVRTFAGDDEICTIEPHGAEDNFDADMAESWVNYVIMRQNRGFLTTYTWIKDAVLSKMGFIKQYWRCNRHRQRIDLEGLTDFELQKLQEAEDFKIADKKSYQVAHVVDAGGQELWVSKEDVKPGMEFVTDAEGDIETATATDVTGYQVSEEWVITEENLPPEEVGFLADTKEIPWKCRFIYHRTEKSIGELRQLFPDVDIPDDIMGFDISDSGIYDEETIQRFYDTSSTLGLNNAGEESFIDPTMRKVWLYEIYMLCDRDGDGTPEWVQLFRVGDTALEVEEVSYPKLFAITPIIWTHRAVGLSLADLLYDLQELQTVLNRQILDHIYQSNNPRTEIDVTGMTEDTLDDYLDNRIGGYVRVERPGTVRPLLYSQLAPWTFNLLEHWEQKRESRTGISRMNGGLDPNSLNKTATGIVQILNQAARRIELIARTFAETGFRDRIRGILDLSAEYPEYAADQVMRLEGTSKPLDPMKITGRYDLIVNAGIGTGNKEQHAAHMMSLLGTMKELMLGGLGPGSEKQLVTLKNLYNVIRDMITNMGHRNTADYITDPDDKEAQRDPPAQPKPSPDELKMQVELKKIEADREKNQQDSMLAREELQLKRMELEIKSREVATKEWQAGAQEATHRMKVQAEIDKADKEDSQDAA